MTLTEKQIQEAIEETVRIGKLALTEAIGYEKTGTDFHYIPYTVFNSQFKARLNILADFGIIPKYNTDHLTFSDAIEYRLKRLSEIA